MKTYREFNESLDTIVPKPIVFGSNNEWDDEHPYTDKKFAKFTGNLYHTFFKIKNGYFRVLFDKSTGELSFQVSSSEDISEFSDEKIGVNIPIIPLFSSILYIVSFLVKQYNPPSIMWTAKEHTKKIYDYMYKNKAIQKVLANLGYVKDESKTSGYHYKKA